jgi:hypothetical protein
MTDNIHLAQELVLQYNRKRISPRCMLKIDLRKAYDTFSWSFLYSVLGGLGFPFTFIYLVMTCVSSTSFSVQVNGDLFGFFKGKRGLRQGDPISPFLFVLCLEYFSRSLNSATSEHPFNYHPKWQALRITYLAFFDDLLLFARGDVDSIGVFCTCLSWLLWRRRPVDRDLRFLLLLSLSPSSVPTGWVPSSLLN